MVGKAKAARMRLSLATALFMAASMPFGVATSEAADGPRIHLLHGEPIGDPVSLPGGWGIQTWKQEDGDRLCVLAVGTEDAAINLIAGGGGSEFQVWSSVLTDSLKAEDGPDRLNMVFNGWLPMELEGVSWEFGLVAADFTDGAGAALLLADTVALSLEGYDDTVTFTLNASKTVGDAMGECIASLLK